MVANQQLAEFAGFDIAILRCDCTNCILYTVLYWKTLPTAFCRECCCEFHRGDQPQMRTRDVQVEEACTVSSKAVRYAVRYLATVANASICVANVSRLLKWCFDLFGWLWEWFSDTILKHHRLVFIRNTLVHHWTIPVTLHVSLETLMGSTPTNLTNL